MVVVMVVMIFMCMNIFYWVLILLLCGRANPHPTVSCEATSMDTVIVWWEIRDILYWWLINLAACLSSFHVLDQLSDLNITYCKHLLRVHYHFHCNGCILGEPWLHAPLVHLLHLSHKRIFCDVFYRPDAPLRSLNQYHQSTEGNDVVKSMIV